MTSTFRTKFRTLVRRRRLSLLKVSKELGLAYSSVHKWYTGDSRPTEDNLPALAQLLDVPASVLADDRKSLPDEAPGTSLCERLFAVIDGWGFLDIHVINWANKGKGEAREEGRPVSMTTLKRWRQGNLTPTTGELDGILRLLNLQRQDLIPELDTPTGPGRGRSASAGIPQVDCDTYRKLMARLFARAMIEREYVTNPEQVQVLEKIAAYADRPAPEKKTPEASPRKR